MVVGVDYRGSGLPTRKVTGVSGVSLVNPTCWLKRMDHLIFFLTKRCLKKR
jgi:hypothetical protein